MEYLVKKFVRKPKSLNSRKPKMLYVADTHTYNLRGKQIISLTDLREYAQEFGIEEASVFIKKNPGFVIEEKTHYREEGRMEE